jgi:hypothetical protein
MISAGADQQRAESGKKGAIEISDTHLYPPIAVRWPAPVSRDLE